MTQKQVYCQVEDVAHFEIPTCTCTCTMYMCMYSIHVHVHVHCMYIHVYTCTCINYMCMYIQQQNTCSPTSNPGSFKRTSDCWNLTKASLSLFGYSKCSAKPNVAFQKLSVMLTSSWFIDERAKTSRGERTERISELKAKVYLLRKQVKMLLQVLMILSGRLNGPL